jgi:hypothetical protein
VRTHRTDDADATRRIPDGAQVAVDGVAGIVRWMI